MIVGCIRGVFWLCSKYDTSLRLCRRRPNHPRIEVRLPLAFVQPAILDRATAAIAPLPPIRAYPAVAPEGILSDSAPQLARNSRRRQPRSSRR